MRRYGVSGRARALARVAASFEDASATGRLDLPSDRKVRADADRRVDALAVEAAALRVERPSGGPTSSGIGEAFAFAPGLRHVR